MKKSIFASIAAGALSLALVHAVPAFAEHDKTHKKDHQCMIKKIDEMKAELNLTPEQEAKLKMIKQKNKMFMDVNRKEMRDMFREADEISMAETIDQMKLDALARKACKMRSETLKHHIMLRHEIRQILTEDQRNMIKAKLMESIH